MMRSRVGLALVLAILILALAACGGAVTTPDPPDQVVEMAVPDATEDAEHTWTQLLPRDAILPVYDPEFVPAEEAGYDDRELVMGVEIEGEAKAYPVGVLNNREMVNDEVGGTPVLVTW